MSKCLVELIIQQYSESVCSVTVCVCYMFCLANIIKVGSGGNEYKPELCKIQNPFRIELNSHIAELELE